ncbi:glycogen/starch/alpha-glucan phosphorylase [Aerococcus urinae]
MNTIAAMAKNQFHKSIEDISDQELYYLLLDLIKDKSKGLATNHSKKKLYYVSAEFLIGKLLVNNLLNLGIYDQVEEELQAHGRSLTEVEQAEKEPSLGNGGLGRLASCFLDSIASLGMNGDGIGLNYHFGLFRQFFDNNQQTAKPDDWLGGRTWLNRTETTFTVPFKNGPVASTLYEIDIIGFKKGERNRLRLFDLDTVNSDLIQWRTIQFDKKNIPENLTLFLYPDDSDHAGRMLRIYQQYFMVSNAAQLIIREALDRGSNLHDLADYAVIQINDTHPTFIIPELIRLLTEDHDFTFEEAVAVVRQVVAFTNHTILSEALEKWPLADIEAVQPEIANIICRLDRQIKEEFPDNHAVEIIDGSNTVHMASIAIHFGFSTNGVARLHSQILVNSELKAFADIYPEKFSNKTNGITFRRWIMAANPRLAHLIDQSIGDQWHQGISDLSGLSKEKNNKDFMNQLAQIKQANKDRLAEHLRVSKRIEIKPDSIIDVQIKRIHEYKRQQMLALYIIYKYFDIKNGNRPQTPITILFGGKAAPAYTIAQDIIHLILTLSALIKEDPEVAPYLQVEFVSNYNVTEAEYLIPAADISEQISLASKEASGTGNMKFMLNGALTICTLDGANVEIAERVGEDNIYTFGKSSDEIIDLYANNGYNPQDYYNRPAIKALVDFIVSAEMIRLGHESQLRRLYEDIKNKDYFMAMIDLEEYIALKDKMYQDYEDQEAWLDKVLVNISEAGYFSSDRTILEYNEDIWHLEVDDPE